MIAPRHSKLKLEPEREHERKQRRCLKCRKLFMSDWLATDVVGCSRLMVNAGVILVTSSPAFAHHDTVGGGEGRGGGDQDYAGVDHQPAAGDNVGIQAVA